MSSKNRETNKNRDDKQAIQVKPAPEAKKKPRIAIYAIGGCGLNTVGKTRDALEEVAPDIEKDDIAFYFADGSLSDTTHIAPDDSIFTVDGLGDKGFGKKRNNEGLVHVQNALPKFMMGHPPGDYNILVLSTMGGIGSTLGSLVGNEILAGGGIMLTIAVTGGDSTTELKNSVKTLQGFNSIAKRNKLPFVARLFDNYKGRDFADRSVAETIIAMTLMFSTEIQGLDYSDVKHFFQYTEVKDDVEPSLVSMNLSNEQPQSMLDSTAKPCWAAVGMLDSPKEMAPGEVAGYCAYGFVDKGFIEKYDTEAVPLSPALWATIDPQGAADTVATISAKVDELEKAQKAMDSDVSKIDMPDLKEGSILIL